MKKVLISILTLILIISMITVVSAATTGDVTLEASSGTIKAGDEFTITASATDSNNLNTVEYSGVTITDANGEVSSAITIQSIEAASDTWARMANGANTDFVYSGSAIQSSEVFKINLKASDTIAAGTYNINMEGLIVYSANINDDTTTVGTKTISVSVAGDTTTVDTTNTTTVIENTTPSTTDSNIGSSSSTISAGSVTTSGVEESEDDKELPQTGLEIGTIIAIIALGAIAIGSYVSYKRYKNM